MINNDKLALAYDEIDRANRILKLVVSNMDAKADMFEQVGQAVGYVSSAQRYMQQAAGPANDTTKSLLADSALAQIELGPLHRYDRKVIDADVERGEIFEEERPDLDEQEADDVSEMVRGVAKLAVSLLAYRAGEFRADNEPSDSLVEQVAETLREGGIEI